VQSNTKKNRQSGGSRRHTFPSFFQKKKSIMKIVTADESVHSVYGQPKEGQQEKPKRNIDFKAVEIREYARTVGDNPSCSSGPPIS
jgi:hypothetical protein